MSERWPYYHRTGDNPCGGIMFYLIRKPLIYQMLKARDVQLLNGEAARGHDRVVCGTCGRRPYGRWLRIEMVGEPE